MALWLLLSWMVTVVWLLIKILESEYEWDFPLQNLTVVLYKTLYDCLFG